MSNIGITPTADRILVQTPESKSKIVLPDGVDCPINEAIVIAVGPGRQEGAAFIKPFAQPGDKVILLPNSRGVPVKGNDGLTYHIINNAEVLAVVSPPNTI